MAGEFDFIQWISTQQRPDRRVPVPIGDDLAAVVWDGSDLLLVGVDQVLDGRHFDAKRHLPAQIGRKAMNRNLSDCAAMAALPAYAVTTLALPADASIDYARALYTGMRDAAAEFGCEIVGGDTGSWNGPLAITVTILGRSAGVAPVTRGGASPGDFLYVTGPLGGSIGGRHLTFSPRVALARELATRFRITSMIDISDGLSRDLGHLCAQSRCGAVVDAAAVPVHDDVRSLTFSDRSPLEHALHDGEDHELLFTSPDSVPPELAIRIGQVTEGRERVLQDGDLLRPLETRGWEHRLGSS
ncbi:MAG TPA: thiamine-phosphate kinase [Tepidisphaeraceae bacterium]|jgi:thiamine-monophosphate kinase|nr:thiamine-phosphate kinase [Tepidisphaeraceae bacterium]